MLSPADVLLRLRAEARTRQGDRFSLKAFHDAVLLGGGMPLAAVGGAVFTMFVFAILDQVEQLPALVHLLEDLAHGGGVLRVPRRLLQRRPGERIGQLPVEVRGERRQVGELRDVDVDIPKKQLTVVTGVSGSGKSSLAFDTIYAEGQRRYVESLSAYARQFLGQMDKPDVDFIEGLSPAVSIDQKSTNRNPRSTVGTITEVYDYLRLLYARVGSPRCPDHGYPLEAQTVSQMVDQVLALGADPATILGAVTPVPDTLSEYQFAGLLRGGRTELAKCITPGVDGLQVPARAEIVMEGLI